MEEVLTIIAYALGAIVAIGSLITLGIVLVGILTGLYLLAAWVIDGIRD